MFHASDGPTSLDLEGELLRRYEAGRRVGSLPIRILLYDLHDGVQGSIELALQTKCGGPDIFFNVKQPLDAETRRLTTRRT